MPHNQKIALKEKTPNGKCGAENIKFGFKFKAIFCPLTSEKDYATISPTKRQKISEEYIEFVS